MDACLLDVLHDAADHRATAGVSHGVDVDLDGLLEEAVDQDGPLLRDPALSGQGTSEQPRHGQLEAGVVIADLHRSPTEDVARPHQHRVADLGGHGQGLSRRGHRAAGWLGHVEARQQLVEALPVLGQVD